VDELRTTVQEGGFQVSKKGVFNVRMGWQKRKERKGGGKKGSQGYACADALLVYMLIKDCG
jgi:hypothetical protein